MAQEVSMKDVCPDCFTPHPPKLMLSKKASSDGPELCGNCACLQELELAVNQQKDKAGWDRSLDDMMNNPSGQCLETALSEIRKVNTHWLFAMCTMQRMMQSAPPETTLRQFMVLVIAELVKHREERRSAAQGLYLKMDQ